MMIVVHLIRKPLAESSVAANVLEHSTGGLHVDACRIGTEETLQGGSRQIGDGIKYQIQAHPDEGYEQNPHGRWPPNMILEHRGGCDCIGTQQVPGHKGYPNGPKGNHFSVGDGPDGSRQEAWRGHADADGLETVEDWKCRPDCPVRDLEGQSGVTTNTSNYSYKRSGEFIGSIPSQTGKSHWHAETGTAARFFKQVKG